MLGPYLVALRTPGAARFSAAGMLGRATMAMPGLGTVLLVEGRTGSYALAGALVAANAVSIAVGGPFVSGLIDRHGQARIVRPLVTVHSTAWLLFITAVLRDAPIALLFALMSLIGFTAPTLGSYVRARWANLLSGDPRMRAAFAWESLVEELFFVVGPPLAVFMALNLGAPSPLIAVALLSFAGSWWLAAQRSTEPPVRERGADRGSALASRGMPVLVAGFVLLGMVFGGFEVTTIAFAEEQDAVRLTGVLLGSYAAGSLVAAVVFGALHLRATWRRQFLVAMCAVAVTLLPLPYLADIAPDPVGALMVVAVIAGFGVSPSLISGFSLVESLVPAARLTEGLAWAVTGITVGLALASAAVGALIDTRGSAAAYAFTSAVAVAGAVVAVAGQRALAGRPVADEPDPVSPEPDSPRAGVAEHSDGERG